MKFHWKVLVWMLAGVVLGLVLQSFLDAGAYAGTRWRTAPGGIELVSVTKKGPAEKSKLEPGLRVTGVIVERDRPDERTVPMSAPEDFDELVATRTNGDMLWLVVPEGDPRPLPLVMDPGSDRARVLGPFQFVADIFMALLKMLIVPVVLTSIVVGVAGLGSPQELGRLGGKTFLYYMATSLLAIVAGQTLVNVIRPGEGATLGLSPIGRAVIEDDASFVGVLKRMVPENAFSSLSDNSAMLQIIFFALLLGYFITQTSEPHRTRVTQGAESLLEVIMKLAEGILKLIPYGVFALIVGIVGSTGVGVFKPLLLYMATVTLALAVHACVTLPLLLRLKAGISPLRWFKAMSPALITAFSTSSSSLTLPVTLETVEKRGKVSNKVSSFTLPLGATINMDGTALYECIGVIFLAQYYAGIDPNYTLTLGQQGLVVLMALLASVGAAGIPSAGLVMMLTILSALKLPLEGATLLLAVDRPLDMLRTTVNVWSDSCAAAVVSRSEGEEGPLSAGDETPLPASG